MNTNSIAPPPGAANGPNVDLLTRTLAHIEAHPEQWDQTMWATRGSCGTSYCFAGWAVALSGGKPNFADDFAADVREGVDDSYHVLAGSIPGITETYYGAVARQLLGLEPYQSNELFDDCNSLDDLRRIVGKLTGAEGVSA